MTELKIFENEEFGEIRTTQDEKGNVLFCGSDVAKALGYSNSRKAIIDHCRYVTKRDTPHPQNISKTLKLSFIPESDVYRLIIKSKLPTAEKFEKWVFEEVLPSIRKYGGYVTEETLARMFNDPNYIHIFLSQMLEMTEKIKGLNKKVNDLQPKADYFDEMMDSELLINFRNTAKEIGVKPMYLINFMLERKYLYRDTKKVLCPYQKYVEYGYFEMIEFCRNGHIGFQTLVTPQGRNHFLQLYLDGEMEAGSVAPTGEF